MTTRYIIWGYDPKVPGKNRLWMKCSNETEVTRTLSELRYETNLDKRFVVEDRYGNYVKIVDGIKPLRMK